MTAKGSGKVILHALPRAYTCPNISPFVIKLETYLRIKNIDYEIDFSKPFGPFGKSPWITFEGKDVYDSQLCIEFLQERFNLKETDLSEREAAVARAVRVAVEERLRWCHALDKHIFEEQKYLKDCNPDMPGYPAFMQGIVRYYMKKSTRDGAHAHGIGRHTREVVENNFGYKDLQALSILLGAKDFFVGSKATDVDCAVFGVLCMIVYTTHEENFYFKAVKNDFPNLWKFVQRIKEENWTDWEECKTRKRQ